MYIMTDRGWQPLWTITADADNGLVAPEWPALAGRHNHEEALVIKSSRAQFITNQRNLLKALREAQLAAQGKVKSVVYAVKNAAGLYLGTNSDGEAVWTRQSSKANWRSDFHPDFKAAASQQHTLTVREVV